MHDDLIFDWCERSVGSRPARVLFRSGQLSRVLGVETVDGRTLVIKSRPYEPRLIGCLQVQGYLAAAGLPCPQPLAGPDELCGQALTAESLLADGELLPADSAAEPFAVLLARLIEAAPKVEDVAPLTPAPPWAAWDHGGSQTWPARDDHGRPLNTVRGPEWVDAAAAAVRRRLETYRAKPHVGHGDWESQNLRWHPGAVPAAVYDWDSAIAQPEAVIAGLASAVWPAAGAPGEAATVEQSEEFLDAYRIARQQTWSEVDQQAAWAGGLWVRLFNAKKDAVDGGGLQLDRLADEFDDRAGRAGITRTC